MDGEASFPLTISKVPEDETVKDTVQYNRIRSYSSAPLFPTSSLNHQLPSLAF